MNRTLEKVDGNAGIYRRDGRYVAIVGYRDGSGKRKQRWITCRTLRAAQDARRQLLNELDRGFKPDRSRMTVAEFVTNEWLPEVEARLRPLSAMRYRQVALGTILPAIGGRRLRDVDRDALREFYKGLATASKARYVHRILSSMFTYAVKELGLLSSNPCASVRAPKAETRETRHLDLPEAQRMLDVAQGHVVEPAIILGLVGGLRRAEVVVIRWRDLDLETGRLQVGGSYWGPTKSGKPRGLTLPASAVASLRRCKTAQAEGLLRIGVRQDDDTPVFAQSTGQPYKPDSLAGSFERFCREYGFDVSFHGLRHTAAILMLSSGVDVKTAASRLGDSLPVFMGTYAHFVRAADEYAAEKLESLLGPVTQTRVMVQL